ncbi:MAG: phosphoribosylformimino-5-aminoimidazole carboxamide ribotide isomerase [Lachnospiraceae bacterium]|jgi:phosphoribosylformimino-5-aminoimidazole carboxamide ribotide isomerase|nr:phosphoribosylformimino-5-aminoimidazole carboxamide ribotide isomerase [Lachnospiraceae bacterium]
MRFRPCIDIHNGKVKQIVGGSLRDTGDEAAENFVSEQTADFYADLYRRDKLPGGHMILLNPPTSPYYEATRRQAFEALYAFPGGLQVGGGITPENAGEYLDAGASHVIVTSYVFQEGQIHRERLRRLVQQVGREHLVLDLSCRRREDGYYIVTDRWQRFTQVKLDVSILEELGDSCDEYLIHAVDVEGKAAGIETEVASLLGEWGRLPMTYAGGVGSLEDVQKLEKLGKGRLDVTIGSALDLFGGCIKYKDMVYYTNRADSFSAL